MGALIPWGLSAVFYMSTFGIPAYGTGGYAPWAILSYLVPIFAGIYAITGIGIKNLTDEEQEISLKELEEDI